LLLLSGAGATANEGEEDGHNNSSEKADANDDANAGFAELEHVSDVILHGDREIVLDEVNKVVHLVPTRIESKVGDYGERVMVVVVGRQAAHWKVLGGARTNEVADS